ncbi:hypothetical protein AV530_009117 [Patagioenas fasciata monilis]|uniref:Uncharacterized protein n=1 Tax=Patagioenas fasciata monilis TaxID=372326 RepID=A0A1V4KD93_PATFA|nr:hypothetical protein AV530_009117 [Patagioenas fasciata monilis]
METGRERAATSHLHKFRDERNVRDVANSPASPGSGAGVGSGARSAPESGTGLIAVDRVSFRHFFSAEKFFPSESNPDDAIAVGSFAKLWFSCV